MPLGGGSSEHTVAAAYGSGSIQTLRQRYREMAVGTPSITAQKFGGLDPQKLAWIYRTLYLSRKMNEREILLHRQGRSYFQISAAGHEALQIAAALALRPGYDWFYPYYRDRALCLALGVQPYQMFLQGVGGFHC